MFFGNAEPLLTRSASRCWRRPRTQLVVLSFEESPDLDSTALETLGEFCSWLSAHGLRCGWRVSEPARDALLRAAIPSLPPSALDYSSVDDAVRGQPVAPQPGKSA